MVTVTFNEERDKGTVFNNYAVTNWTEDHAINGSTETLSGSINVLSTLIADLVNQGIIKGSVAT